MLKLPTILTCAVACCFLAAPVFALTAEESEHSRSAFLFSDRKQWDDALAHATQSNDQILQILIKWQYVLDVDSRANFSEIRDFILMYPEWPEQKRLRIRAEMAIAESNLSAEEVIAWLGSNPPYTGAGKVALVGAMQKTGKQPEDKIQSMIREAWVNGDFSEWQEKNLLENYGNYIRKEDDEARVDRLVWEKKYSAAERMFPRVSSEHKKMYQARMALQTDKKNAVKLVNDLTPAMKKDIGLSFDRMVHRSRQDDENGVRELLLAAPKKVPYPEKWWKYREFHIREAMGEGNSKLAERLISNHGQDENQEFTQGYADASWLKGRMLLEYKKQPKEAYQIFSKMFEAVKYPVSKARAAYWAAKAAKKNGDLESAQKWYETASSYPTTFYGQLASLLTSGSAPLRLPPSPKIAAPVRDEFNSRSIVQAISLCINSGELRLAEKLINHMVSDASDENTAMLASELGEKAGKTYLSVRGAKKALRNNMIMVEVGYPSPDVPNNLAVPRELALSITRQESEFDAFAKSSAGALGLMQLLPTTARETAKKNDMDFYGTKLFDADYNMTLGSLYLRRMIDNYDGSVVMAVAAYNAGPGNVYKWVQKFGRPQNTIDGMVDWIENIPFAETRNYVQRVLENLQVYRHMQAQKSANSEMARLQLESDLLSSSQ